MHYNNLNCLYKNVVRGNVTASSVKELDINLN